MSIINLKEFNYLSLLFILRIPCKASQFVSLVDIQNITVNVFIRAHFIEEITVNVISVHKSNNITVLRALRVIHTRAALVRSHKQLSFISPDAGARARSELRISHH